MRYDIFNRKAPAMPKSSKGTEFCKLLLSQASKDMQEPLVPMAIPAFDVNLTNVKFMYFDEKLRIVQPNWALDRNFAIRKALQILPTLLYHWRYIP